MGKGKVTDSARGATGRRAAWWMAESQLHKSQGNKCVLLMPLRAWSSVTVATDSYRGGKSESQVGII